MYDASPDHGDPAREARRRANLHRPRGTPVRRSQFRRLDPPAQVERDAFSLAKYRAERAAIRKERNYLEISASVQGTLTSFNDPWIEVSGGDNSIAAIGTFFLDHIFTKDKFSIETKASAKFGYNRIKAVPEGEEGEVGIWYKNQDEFWVQTAPSFNFSKNWSYGAMLKFRTQFANGYKARTQQKEIHRKSTFMSPGYLDLSVGLTYNCPNKSFPVKINMSPVALSAVFVESKQIRENFVYDFSEANKEAGTRKYVEPYGVPSNKTSKYEGGSSIQIDFDRKFGNRDVLRYRTTFFSFYGWISNLGQKNKIAKFSDYIAAYDKWEADGRIRRPNRRCRSTPPSAGRTRSTSRRRNTSPRASISSSTTTAPKVMRYRPRPF